MRRRDFVHGAVALATAAGTCRRAALAQSSPAPKLFADWPYDIVEVEIQDAYDRWQALLTAQRGYPVILGAKQEAISLLTDAGLALNGEPAMDESLEMAGRVNFPADILRENPEEERLSREALKAFFAEHPDAVPKMVDVAPDGTSRVLSSEEARARMLAPPLPPADGTWPAQPSVMMDWSKPYPRDSAGQKIWIALLPDRDGTTVPARLRWGGWNACPKPAVHVAALRSWRERFGAQLVALSFDTLDLKVERRPADRPEALALARELHAYCPDIIDQGFESYSALAASLMVSDWWQFWWD